MIRLAAFGVLAFSACASAVKAPIPSAKRPARVIDAHIHARFTGEREQTSGIHQTEEQLLKEFRASNVVAAVSHTGHDGKNALADPARLKIIQCYGVGPKPKRTALEEAIRKKGFRCFKVYLGYVHQFASHPDYRIVYEVARSLKVPVVFHTGDTYDTNGKLKYADPLTLDEIAVDFRDVNFVIAHVGNPWIQSAAEVAYKNPNVYLEGSALLIGNLAAQDPEKVRRYVTEPLSWSFGYVENPKKLMFGTDWPLTDIASYIDAFKAAIPEEHWDDVFYGNAARVFGIAP